MAAVAPVTHPWHAVPRYRLSIAEYVRFRREGYLVVPGLVLAEHVSELSEHAEAIARGDILLPGVTPPSPEMTPQQRDEHLLRIHMGHYHHELWERYLLYPRILDVLEALIGPDVLAMQTMLFRKGPGSNGQGFHQDTFYIPTFPDTLCGAWIAIDRADTENGCLRMSVGSQHEPIYPPAEGFGGYGDRRLEGIPHVAHVGGHQNDDDDPQNTLKPIADRYAEHEVPVIAEPGDVVFFAGHVFHRSLRNRSTHRTRRSLVNHYCNARSFTTWVGGNAGHILARGNTHLPFAKPRFGTPCAALDPQSSDSDDALNAAMMMAEPDGHALVATIPPVDADHRH